MNKKLIRLTEADLHRIVRESVNKLLNEDVYDEHDKQLENFYQIAIEQLEKSQYGKPSQIKKTKQGGLYFDVTPTRFKGNMCWRILQRIKKENDFSCKICDLVDEYRVESLSAEGRFHMEMHCTKEVEVYKGRKLPSLSRSNIVDSPRVQTNDNGEYLGYY